MQNSSEEGVPIATIRDVAKKAGVSISTVSAVTNNNKPVSAALRRKVAAVIAELDYQPNPVARALYTKRTNNLAFLVPSITNPFFSAVLRSVEDTALRRGYSVFVGSTDGDQAKVKSYHQRLQNIGIDGLLAVLSWDIVNSGIIETVIKRGLPVVGVAGGRIVSEIDCYIVDDIAAGEQAAQYLIGLGHRRIAFLGAIDSQQTALRYQGVQRALLQHGLHPDPHLLVQVEGHTEEYVHKAISRLVVEKTEFSAIIAFNDIMALGALSALDDFGFTIPEDVSVLGFDDTLAAYSRPKLTTMAFPKQALGEQAVLRLISHIEGSKQPPAVHMLPPELVVRQSTRRIAAKNAD